MIIQAGDAHVRHLSPLKGASMKAKNVLTIVLTTLALNTVWVLMSERTAHAGGPWYVSTTGTVTNNCLSPTSPCPTINGALGKATVGDTIYVAVGTYRGTGDQVVSINKNITLSGGWNEDFSSQTGFALVDGQGLRRGITVNYVEATIDHFIVQNAAAYDGAGIAFKGGMNSAWTLSHSIIQDNIATWFGGGVCVSYGNVVVNNSAIINNTAKAGGGLSACTGDDFAGDFYLNNTTVSGNTAEAGAGVTVDALYGDGTLTLRNSTITNNVAGTAVGGVGYTRGITLTNSIVAYNVAAGTLSDCEGSLTSLGYNLISEVAGCTITASIGDVFNTDPRLFPLTELGYHPLRLDSLAVDGGNPTGCRDHLGSLFATDQRGSSRSLDGNSNGTPICDIGAYELDPDNYVGKYRLFLPLVQHAGH